jgi:hypothetical protein
MPANGASLCWYGTWQYEHGRTPPRFPHLTPVSAMAASAAAAAAAAAAPAAAAAAAACWWYRPWSVEVWEDRRLLLLGEAVTMRGVEQHSSGVSTAGAGQALVDVAAA